MAGEKSSVRSGAKVAGNLFSACFASFNFYGLGDGIYFCNLFERNTLPVPYINIFPNKF